MTGKPIRRIIIPALLTLAVVLCLSGCLSIDPDSGMLNSAEVYCMNLGHDTFKAPGEEGEDVYYCVFDDGTACEMLDFFYGDCAPERSICSMMGLGFDHYTSPDNGIRYARCVFPDNTTCMVFDYALFGDKCQRVREVDACADVPGGICP